MDGLTVTIVGGVVVVVIGLVLEYGVFQRRKRNQEELSLSPTEAQVERQSLVGNEVSIPRQPGTTGGKLSWPEAINKAVESFRTLHPGNTVTVVSTDAKAETANLFVAVVSKVGTRTYYSLAINKAGEIESIQSHL